MRTYGDFGRYGEWVRRFDTLDHEDRKAIQDSVRLLDRPPLFSVILLPWTNLEPSLAYTSIASICRQLYPHWELWLPHLPDELETNADQRLRTISALPPADGVRLFNAALAKAEGDYVLPLPSNAILGEAALFELATLILEFPGADLLYSDEDHIDASDNRYAPRFKTDWDPDLALGRDAIGLLVAYRRTLVEQLGGMDVQTDVAGLGTYDLSGRFF